MVIEPRPSPSCTSRIATPPTLPPGQFKPRTAHFDKSPLCDHDIRNLKRWILPVAVLGSSGKKVIQRGYL
jgi:hypothetical protein